VKDFKRLFSLIVVVVCCVVGSTTVSAQSEITLMAPSPTRATMEKIVAAFTAKTEQKVKVTYLSGVITRQSVAKGQSWDVNLIVAPFPSAVASGMIDPSTKTKVTAFLTAVAVPKGFPKPDISTPEAVKKSLLAAKKIGYEDPDFASAGYTPFEVITKLGIVEQVSTQRRLQDKQIDIGMLYLSDMLPNKDKVDIIGVLPRQIATPTDIVGFIGRKASNPDAAKGLLKFFLTPEAQAMFKEGGYETHN
jgi:molybdate transport system substrate-binding protein